MDPSEPIPVAIVQHAPVFLNLEASLQKAGRLVEYNLVARSERNSRAPGRALCESPRMSAFFR